MFRFEIVSVDVPDPVLRLTLEGFNVKVGPEGVLEAVSGTLPVNPFRPDSDMVEVGELDEPAPIVMLAGLAARV